MSDEARITGLAQELVKAWQKDPASVPQIDTADAFAMVSALHFEMDRRTAVLAEEAAAESLTIACKEGCAHCCENLVVVYRGESVAVAQWLSLPENEATKQQFLDAYPTWRRAVGEAPETSQAAARAGDQQTFANITIDVWRRGVMCAFNRDDLCTIYDVRPNGCRGCHALSTSEFCTVSGGRPPDTLESSAVDNFRDGVRPLQEALHVALGGEAGVLAALCRDVYELLTKTDD